MPIETQRKIGIVKWSSNNIGGTSIPCIMSITFADDTDRGQEWEVTFENGITTDSNPGADREITYSWVCALDQRNKTEWNQENVDPNQPPPSTTCGLVERIQRWKDLDKPRRGQETWTSIDNKNYSSGGPPFFVTHQKTHCVKLGVHPGEVANPDDYYDADGNVVGDNYAGMFELIDELTIVDQRGQETTYILQNPKNDREFVEQLDLVVDEHGFYSFSNPVIDQSGLPQFNYPDAGYPFGGPFAFLGPFLPLRLDPFINLVKFPPFVFTPTAEVNQGYLGAAGTTVLSFRDLYNYQGGAGFIEYPVTVPYFVPPPEYAFGEYFSGDPSAPGGAGFPGGTLTGRRDGNYEFLTGAVNRAGEHPTVSGLKPSDSHLFTATAQYMNPPGYRGRDSFTQGHISGHTISMDFLYQDTTSLTHFQATNDIPVEIPPEGHYIGWLGIGTGDQLAYSDSTDFDSIKITWPKDNPYTGETITYDTIGRFAGPSGPPTEYGYYMVISAEATLYSSEYGPPPDSG